MREHEAPTAGRPPEGEASLPPAGHNHSAARHPHAELFEFISTTALSSFDDEHFDRLALKIFAHQIRENAVYRRFCEQLSPAALTPRHWQEIPAVTTSAFKQVPLACFPPEQAVCIFHTSGTTQARSGRHYFRTLEYYRTAALRSFQAYCLPDRPQLRMLFLGPTAEHFPHSSLGYMFTAIREEWGARGSAAFMTPAGLDLAGLRRALLRAQEEQMPVFLLGTAFALVECLEAFAAQGFTPRLPPHSRILDTGGYKGRTRELPRREFQQRLCEVFGVPREFLLNEYGMTELSSQFYESRLPGTPLQDANSDVKFMPPWVRVLAVDPENLRPLPPGETGLLRIFDLANIDSVMAIQTEDVGRAWQDRIELEGRASAAELRGCSLLTERIG
ncbi:MAG: long-chain fatty acid--CoA ligase [candidate division KSB1 bacterium]|nr:long-chain fatty acid--CoA ligase [candidate division KSB1 bacterium]MDZ7276402.1 long-chain fatty acid--CoA ligase [candidate division KSB1 bacterium]MDZ7288073.1 long-chain fatty acid--CoA ligase [candidate division KSB1 bacterium]MDZ7300173.1 long-chain fatty acid--CoA ligase [candidate division KSB1 bacterium]MDZ7308831.1 long-chain fatty acid--CoA ligase [candidate division KSB1 bacterium]